MVIGCCTVNPGIVKVSPSVSSSGCTYGSLAEMLQWLPGDLPSALRDYSSVLVIDPDHLDALVHRGTVNEKLGNLDAAIVDFTRVLELEPNHVKAAYARGACRNLKGDFADAIGEFPNAQMSLQSCRSLRKVIGLQVLMASSCVKSPLVSKATLLIRQLSTHTEQLIRY